MISELNFNLNSNANADNKLAAMAAKVAMQNFDLQYATLLFFNSTLYFGVEVFLRLYKSNVIVNKGTFDPSLANKTRQFVLFSNDLIDLEEILDVFIEFEIENTGKFIVVCQSPKPNDCDEKGAMQLCWKNKIINVAFITSKAKRAAGYTYFPVADGICDNLKPVKLLFNQRTYTTYGKIYGMKLQNMNFCPLTVSTFIQSPYMNITNGAPFGADGDLLRLLAYGLNATLRMRTPHRGDGWGWREKNGTWMGSLADVYEDLANFSMTSAAITSARFADFQISSSYHSAKVVWVSCPTGLQNAALKLLHPFGPEMRVALVFSFLIVVLCAFLIKTDSWFTICRRVELIRPTKSIVFYAWMICMGQAVIKLPTKSAFLQMTVVWVWYCFLIRTTYQVYLISSLKGKFYEDQFNTIEDVISANYPFGGGPALKDYFIDNPLVYDNWVNIETSAIVPTAFNISKGMQFVLAMNEDAAKIIVLKQKVDLRILPQIIVTSPQVVFFKKFSPLTESVNLILQRLTASGFSYKLHQKYTVLNIVGKDDDEGEALKLVHFTACYVLLILGWIVSTIFFCIEIYFGKVYQHPY